MLTPLEMQALEALKALTDDAQYVGEVDDIQERARLIFNAREAIHALEKREQAVASQAESAAKAEPFIIKHYSADERPILKGNGFDGLEIGADREEAEEFVAWVNARLAALREALKGKA